MKKFISKLICIVTIFSMASNSFADNFFRYNSQRKLILPERTTSFSEINDTAKDRVYHLLRNNDALKSELGEDFVDEFLDSATSFDDRWTADDQSELPRTNELFSDLIDKVNALQDDPQKNSILSLSRGQNELHFDDNVDPAGTPEFCSAYPQITPGSVDEFFEGDTRVDNGLAYEGCFGQEPISLPIKDLVSDFAQINNHMVREQEKKAREEIMTMVASAMLEKRATYRGMYDNYPALDEGLKRCLEYSKSSYPGFTSTILDQIDKNEEEAEALKTAELESGNPGALLNQFDVYNATLALVAKNHVDKRNSLRQRFETLSNSNSPSTSHCRNKRGEDKFACESNARARAEARRQELADVKSKLDLEESKLQIVMNESPALFDIEDMGGFWAGAEMRIQPSEYMTSIMNVDGANELASRIDVGLESAAEDKNYLQVREDAIAKLQEENAEQISAFMGNVKANGLVNTAGNDAVYKEMEDLDESLKAICENEGESLHQYTEMFPGLLNQVANKADSAADAQENVKNVQAGLCSLYRKDPPNRNEEPSFAKKAIGYTLIGGGVLFGIATFWTGAGGVMGTAVAAAGGGMVVGTASASMALVGSGVFAEHAYGNYTDARVRETNGRALMSTSWGDVRSYIESREDRVDARNETITEVAFAAPDMIGLGLLANSARILRAGKLATNGGDAAGDVVAALPAPSGGGSGGTALALADDSTRALDDGIRGIITSGDEALSPAALSEAPSGLALADNSGDVIDEGVKAITSAADDAPLRVEAGPRPQAPETPNLPVRYEQPPVPAVVSEAPQGLAVVNDVDDAVTAATRVADEAPRRIEARPRPQAPDTPNLPVRYEQPPVPAVVSEAPQGLAVVNNVDDTVTAATRVADEAPRRIEARPRPQAPETPNLPVRYEQPPVPAVVSEAPQGLAVVNDVDDVVTAATRVADEAPRRIEARSRPQAPDTPNLPVRYEQPPVPAVVTESPRGLALADDVEDGLGAITRVADDAPRRLEAPRRAQAPKTPNLPVVYKDPAVPAVIDDVARSADTSAGLSDLIDEGLKGVSDFVDEGVSRFSALVNDVPPVPKAIDETATIRLTEKAVNAPTPAQANRVRSAPRAATVVDEVERVASAVPATTRRAARDVVTQRADDFISKSTSVFREGIPSDFPKSLKGSRVSWLGRDGVRRFGVVEKVNGKSLRIQGRSTLLRFEDINAAGFSVVKDGRRLSSVADFPDNMMGEFISFFSPAGNRVNGIKRGQLIRRNKNSIVLRVAKDPNVLVDPLDPSTFKVVNVPLSKIHGDSIAHVSYGNANGLRNLAKAEDFAKFEGQTISFYSPFSATLNSNVYVVGLNASEKAVIIRRARPGRILDPQDAATYIEEPFYFSTKRINADSIAVTGRVADEVTPAVTRIVTTGKAVSPVNEAVNLPAVRQTGTDLVPVDGGANLPVVKVYEGELLPRETGLARSATRPALEGRVIEGTAVEVTENLPAVRSTGTALVPINEAATLPAARVYNGEVMPRETGLAKSAPRPALEGRIIEGSAVEVTDKVPTLSARSTAIVPADDVARGADDATDVAKREALSGELLDPERAVAQASSRPADSGITINGTAVKTADTPRTFSRIRMAAGDMWNGAKAKAGRFFSRVRDENSLFRRFARVMGYGGDDTAQIILAGDGEQVDNTDGSTAIVPAAPDPTPAPEPTAAPPEEPTTEADDDNDEFSTGRDGDEEEVEAPAPVRPVARPAARGNPVQPQFIKTISPTIQVKQGTY